MLSLVIAFGVGLVCGWHFIAQPEWAKTMIDKVVSFVMVKIFKKQQ